jgi:hypothetical protein
VLLDTMSEALRRQLGRDVLRMMQSLAPVVIVDDAPRAAARVARRALDEASRDVERAQRSLRALEALSEYEPLDAALATTPASVNANAGGPVGSR